MAWLAPTSKAEVAIAGEPTLVYEILTDYDAYSEWLAPIKQSKLLAKEGDLALAEIEIGMPVAEKLVFECIHDKNRSVLGRVISGKAPIGKIEWTIVAEGPGQTRVAVAVEGKPDWHWILPGYRKMIDARQYAQALAGQAASYSDNAAVSGADGETILDLMETSDGLVLVYRGQKYILHAVSQVQK